MDTSGADSGAAAHEAELDALVLQCLSRAEHLGDAAFDQICAEHPQHADTLRRRFRLLREAGLLGAAPEPEHFPERLGEFRLLRRLGGGGMGVVYAAEQSSLGRQVALKLIRPEHLYFPGARARFLREAQATARLAHPGIVPIHLVGEQSGIPYIAMELVAGASLSTLIARLSASEPARMGGADLLACLAEISDVQPTAADRASLPFSGTWVEACAWIAREVAQALEHAHQRGVIHRDVKPSNVMLTTSGRALLVDFGLASTAGADAVTRSGSVMGSLPYMAPEQVRGQAARVGPRTDLYGLGVTLYELLALRRPFEGADSQSLLNAILEARPRSLRSIAPFVPRDLEALVKVALSPEVERRYATAADLARDLTHVLRREPIEARPAGPWVQLLRWTERHPAAAALTALVLVVGPSLFAWQQWSSGKRIRAEAERADANSVRTGIERDRADANFQSALEAVDTMLSRVGDETLRDVPQMEAVRRDLLEKALAFYGRFLGESGESREVRLRSASTQQKVGRIRRDLDDFEESDRVFASAEATLRELEREAPDDWTVRNLLTAVLENHANTLHHLGRIADTESRYREILGRAAFGIEREPSQVDQHRRMAADVNLYLALLLRDAHRQKEAIVPAESAVDGLRALCGAHPGDADLARRFAEALRGSAEVLLAGERGDGEVLARYLEAVDLHRQVVANEHRSALSRECLGLVLGSLGSFLSRAHFDRHFDPSEASAEDVLREAIELDAGLCDDFPNTGRHQAALAAQSTNLCIHLARSGRAAEALPYGERAAQALEELASLEPNVPRRHSDCGACLNNVAKLLTMTGDAARALELADRAIAAQQRALEMQPGNPGFLAHLTQHHVTRAEALLALHRWNDAAEEARAVAVGAMEGTNKLVTSADLLVRCAVQASDGSAPASESSALHDEAVELLRKALAAGHSRSAIGSNKAFAPLRDHQGFRELVASE